jgi:hypothetical protein
MSSGTDAKIVKMFMSQPYVFDGNFVNQPIALPADFENSQDESFVGQYQFGDSTYLTAGKTINGEWVDVVLLKHWLTRQLEVEVLSKFYTNNKITNPTIIQDTIMAVLERAKKLGGITRYVVRQVPSSERNKPRFEWKAQLSGAINNVTISGTVEP